MTDNEMLTRVFTEKGLDYGFTHVTAGYSQETDLKVAWRRMNGSIDFWVSDYIEEAPEDVLRSLATTIYSRITDDSQVPYSDRALEYLKSDDFVKRNQPIYLGRLDGMTRAEDFRYRNVLESYERLIGQKLVERVPNLSIGWLPLVREGTVGHSSALMRSVCLSRRLDAPIIESELLDFGLYTQVTFVSLEYGADPLIRNRQFMRKIDAYPDSDRLLEQMDCLGMSVLKNLSPEC